MPEGKAYQEGYEYAAGCLLRKEFTPEQLIEQQDCEPNNFDRGMNAAIADFNLQRDELQRLNKWIDDLQSGMFINCVYCGFQYGPKETTIAREALEEHIAICPEHPLSKCKRQLKASRALEAQFFPQWAAYRIVHMLDAAGFGDGSHGNTLLGMTESCLERVATLEHLHNLDHSLADQWQRRNEAMMEFFVGAEYRKLDTIPTFSPEMFRKLGETSAARIKELKAKADAFDTLKGMASVLVANAVVGPDSAMNGATDCYHVPLDDVDALREVLKP